MKNHQSNGVGDYFPNLKTDKDRYQLREHRTDTEILTPQCITHKLINTKDKHTFLEEARGWEMPRLESNRITVTSDFLS